MVCQLKLEINCINGNKQLKNMRVVFIYQHTYQLVLTFDAECRALRRLSDTGKHIFLEVSSYSLCQTDGRRTLTLS